MKNPEEILNLMIEKDSFSKWMGVQVIKIEKGSCIMECVIHDEMLNGFGIAHGGITYSLADSALAFAANAYGYQCVSVETSISHIRQVHINDKLQIVCEEIHRGRSIGIYSVSITKDDHTLIAKFKGTVSISQIAW